MSRRRTPTNLFCVERTPEGITIGNLPLVARRGKGSMPDWPCPAPLSMPHALELAAWLVQAAGGRPALPVRPSHEVLKPHAYEPPHDDPAPGPCWLCLHARDDKIHTGRK